jgi:predicted ATPase/DNA-binding winged helix-turn-helix (wHTH) protein
MNDRRSRSPDVLSFGPFDLFIPERLLKTKAGESVPLGGRALDILIALAERAGEVVTQRELISRVWPDVTAEEPNLRVHIANLRKALGDGRKGARYIVTVPRRGYSFVAPVTQSSPQRQATASNRLQRLPSKLARVFGRDDTIRRLSAQLMMCRFISIVGAGGIGKTTVALSVAHALLDDFNGAVYFVDMAALTDAKLVPTTVARALGLMVQTQDTVRSLPAFIGDKKVLLVLDNCEHVIDVAAMLVERVVAETRQAHVLTTSREAFRVEGEHVHLLYALDCPPENEGLTAAEALTYPAVQLFMERTAASGHGAALSDIDAPIAAAICRRLDGVALAIELAASRAASLGIRGIAGLLDNRFSPIWHGRRTALPRHQTLNAMLDWSYNLLSEHEKAVLSRLSMFVGDFKLDAARSVASDAVIPERVVTEAIVNLLTKSLISTTALHGSTYYRLLETTRLFALAKLADRGERNRVARRHANFFSDFLQNDRLVQSRFVEHDLSECASLIGNVRTALEWAFSGDGDMSIGADLAAWAAPLFIGLSLLEECRSWSERALAGLDDATRGTRQEMILQEALGVSLIFTRGARDAARQALMRSLAIAEDRGDVLEQIRLLGPLSMFHRRIGEYNIALQYAKRCSARALTTKDPVAIVLAHSNLGLSLQPVGELTAARAEFEAAITHGSGFLRNATISFGMDANVLAGAALAVNLWLEGHPAQAIERARRTTQEAARTDHAVSISTALLNAISVLLWAGDLASASEHIDMLISRAESYSFGPFGWLGRGFKGEVAIRRGDVQGGVEALKGSLEKLHEARYNLFASRLGISLIQGLDTMGWHAEAITLADDTIRLVAANGNHVFMPELLRVKGCVLLAMGRSNIDAEMCFVQSLKLSRRQGARAWELRSAIDLAALWAGLGRLADARALLLPAFRQFTEGLDTADLVAAERLLTTLS